MRPHSEFIAMLIFVGITAFSLASASENNSATPQSTSINWFDYLPLVGVLGTAIGIYSLLERRKDRERNAHINEWLEGNVILSDLKKDLETLEENKRDAQYYMDNVLYSSIQM